MHKPILVDWTVRVKSAGWTMISMFAPYCPTCGHRILLGTGRIVAAALDTPRHTLLLRCFCGTVLDAFQETPASIEQAPDSRPVGSRPRAA